MSQPRRIVDLSYISELAKLLEAQNLTEIRLTDGEQRLTLIKHTRRCSQAAPAVQERAESENVKQTPIESGKVVKSPLVGTAYLAPSPGEPLFKKPGDQVKTGDVVLIVEAMKVMNKIHSPYDGILTKVLVDNEDPVEFDQELFCIAT